MWLIRSTQASNTTGLRHTEMISGSTEQFDYQTIVHRILCRFPRIPYYARRAFNRFRRDVMRSSVRENSIFRVFKHASDVYKRKYQVHKYTLNFNNTLLKRETF